MNRSWIAKFSIRALCPALVGTLVLAAWASVQAAPLGTLFLEGRKQGSTDWLRTVGPVSMGDVIEYRLMGDMAPVGTQNGSNTINSLTPGTDGFNSLSNQITQLASDGILVNFGAPAALQNAWDLGIGASGGTVTPRAGGVGSDLMAIRPIHAAGIFSGVDPEMILRGTFTVAGLSGLTGTVTPRWGTASGALRINGAGQVFITVAGQNGNDPVVGLAGGGLTLQAIPEPTTIALAGLGLVGLVAFARRRRAT